MSIPSTVREDPGPPMPDDEGFLPADAPPAWGTESREERILRLLRKSRELPARPGVYLMKDHAGVVLYVGKAQNLPDRVSSYFVPSADLGPAKQPMLEAVHDFDTLVCDSPWEALLAENRLIKDIAPKYNQRMTDGKSFPYLVVTQREDFPRVIVTREPMSEEYRGARVFGPFTAPAALHIAVDVLQRVFKYRTCALDIIEGEEKNRRFRPCLLHAIGRCSAPCADRIGKEAYRRDVDRFMRVLNVRRSEVLREMRADMQAASEAREYERAAALRDQARALERLHERATTGDGWQPEQEISYIDPGKGLKALQRMLGTESPIRCIEGIDIAHLQGGETVGSKVSFIDGRPFKDEYRRFRIRSVRNDDYMAIREVVSRRYREAGAGAELYPDVILIDGGLGQLHAALEAFDTLGVKPPMVIALAKKEELVFVQRRSEPVRVGRENPGLRLLQQVRDEAHRFAQHYHGVLRRKRTLEE